MIPSVFRHLFASAVTISTALAIGVGGYVFLIIWALFGGGGLGSPMTLPILVLGITLAGVAGCLFVLMPSVLLAEKFARRRTFELPMAALCALLLCLVGALSMELNMMGGVVLWLSALLPLIGYWVCVRTAGMVIGAAMSAFNWLRWQWSMRRLSAGGWLFAEQR